MAQIKKEWEKLVAAEDIVIKLCQMYPDKLGHIDPNIVGCAQIANKDPSENEDKLVKMVGIKDPISLYCCKRYIICFYKVVWDGFTDPQKVMSVMAMLLRIHDDADGSILPEDLKDLKLLVKNFGVDYMQNDTLPDLTKSKVDL